MTKILPIGMLTLFLALAAHQQASAWINSRFGVGFNWSWQSGGNNLLWGLLRDGQPPAPCPIPGCQPPFMPGGPMPGGPMMGGPMLGAGGCGPGYTFPGPFHGYPTNEFPFFGRNTTPAAPGANLPQTAQNAGYNGVHHPVGYSPAAAQGYHYSNYTPNYAPQYPTYGQPNYRR